jgi:Carboxypeptidase regulatory-like domain
MNRKSLCLLLFVFAFLSFQSLNAQTTGTGALTGTIKDPSGAVVPTATVTATSLDTGAVRTSMTGADGIYRFSLLPPGNYKVRIEASGFKPVDIPSVTVAVTETEVLDRSMEVGAQAQTVTVEGEVEAIQTTSSALGTVADARTVTELPLNTRNYTNLLSMSTGVAANVSNATTIGKGATNMAVNGGATGQNTYLMDGVVVNNWTALGGVTEGTLPGTFAMPNPDAISEFKIQTSSYDAGYGRNPGANVNVITKSGTNAFHGAAFEFFRNTALNANDWFLAGEGQPKAVLNSNTYGGSVGGPIKKDKLFFFVNYQEEDQTNGYASYSQSQTLLPPIPTGNRGTCGPAGFTSIASCDAAGAAFVTALAANMSPAAFAPTKGTAGIQNPATCGAACSPMGLYNINPIAIGILQLKLPNGGYLVPGSGDFADCASPTAFCSHRFENPASFKDHQGVGNLDYVINSKNTFSGRYVYETDPINANFPAVNALEPGDAVPGNTVSTQKSNQDVVAKLTTVLGNSAVNEFHVGYQRNVTVNSEAVLFHNSQLGIQDFVSPFTPGAAVDNMSYINIGPGGSQMDFGVHPFFGSHANFNQFIVGDSISITHGKHTFRFGTDIERVQGASFSGTGSVGQPAFPTFSDFLIGRAGCTSLVTGSASAPGQDPANPGGCNGGAASNITGTGGTTTANSTSQVNPRVLLPSAYVQDDFKVTSRFTLNLGLRWEFDRWPTENNGNYSTFWQTLAASGAPPILVTSTGARQTTATNTCVPGAPPSACLGEGLAGYVVPSNYTAVIPQGVFQNATPFYTRTTAPLDDFAPRIGFAWQPTHSDKLVLRGGAGYFYDLLSGQYTGNFGRSNPLFGPPAQGSPAATLQNPWAIPGGVVPAGPNYFGFVPKWIIPGTCATSAAATSAAKCGGASSNTGVTSYQDLTIPLTYEWNMNVQYEFLPSWVMELGYVGSHGIHQASPGAVQNNTADGSPITIPYNEAQLVGFGPCSSCAENGVTVNTPANTFLRVPALGISTSAAQLETISNYTFNSLQATVRHQFAHGFQLQAAYSWSRGFEQVPTGVNTYPYVVEEYAPEYFVRPQRLIVNYVWNLPVPRMNGVLGKLVDDWSWSGVLTIQDGQPIDIVDSNDGGIFGLAPQAANIGEPQLCPGYTASQILTSGSASQRVANGLTINPATGAFNNGWINSAAFISCGDAVPSNVGAINGVGGGVGFGNYGFGNILGPGQDNWDMSLAKQFRIHEAQSLEFRTEIYNTFNHPQFSNLPGSDVQNGTGMGQITTTSVNPRVIQFALKFLF